MTFALHVDAPRWRAQLMSVRDGVRQAIQDSNGDLVPVIKGNGYGLGNHNLVTEAGRLGLTHIAVGTIFEATELLADTDADILVLTPFDPRDTAAADVWQNCAAGPHHARLVRTECCRTPSRPPRTYRRGFELLACSRGRTRAGAGGPRGAHIDGPLWNDSGRNRRPPQFR